MENKYAKGDPVKYRARTHNGTGTFLRREGSGDPKDPTTFRGNWVILKRDDNGKELALREAQVIPKGAAWPGTVIAKAKPKAAPTKVEARIKAKFAKVAKSTEAAKKVKAAKPAAKVEKPKATAKAPKVKAAKPAAKTEPVNLGDTTLAPAAA